jgi:hypothetical protein
MDLTLYDLEGMLQGASVTLYHGTTRMFAQFDPSKSRDELVDRFYGSGIFLTPSKRVAWKYANANRNMGFDHDEILADLNQVNRNAALFLETLYQKGSDAWEEFGPARFGVAPEDYSDTFERWLGGVDPNLVMDVAGYILGSKETPVGGGDPINIFNTSTGLPSWVYDTLDKLGLDSKKYRPKVYTVKVTVNNPLVTASKSAAKSARSKGYDSVVFHGSDLVDGVPEVAVFDPQNVRITGVEHED